MSVIYKIIKLRSNPFDQSAPKRYYPKAITLGQSVNLRFLTDRISGNSSLSRGDVLSVIQNFVEELKEQLLEGKSVNVAGLGVFKLSLRSKGEDKAEEVKAKSVRSVRICFQASKDLRINRTETRAGEKLELIRLDDYLKEKEEEVPSSDGDDLLTDEESLKDTPTPQEEVNENKDLTELTE